uniref:SFRICE_030970 n=1 Tax=Spodoptera frugiperda TaxID=7108 RepID=A0A2H1WBI8_SPOFR
MDECRCRFVYLHLLLRKQVGKRAERSSDGKQSSLPVDIWKTRGVTNQSVAINQRVPNRGRPMLGAVLHRDSVMKRDTKTYITFITLVLLTEPWSSHCKAKGTSPNSFDGGTGIGKIRKGGNPVTDCARQSINRESEESTIHFQYKYGRLNVTTIALPRVKRQRRDA